MSLKMCALVVLLVVGMSSCLKMNDSFNMYVQYSYALQNDNGKFTPQVRLVGNDLESVSVNITGKNFAFRKLNDFTWELTDNFFFPLEELDSIPAGYYVLTANGLNGKSESLGLGFLEVKKKMSSVDLTTLEYSEKNLKVELADSVQNATVYYLMIKIPTATNSSTYAMWMPYSKLDLTGDSGEKKLSATVSISNLGTEKYRFAVGASYGSAIRISEKTIAVENEKQVE